MRQSLSSGLLRGLRVPRMCVNSGPWAQSLRGMQLNQGLGELKPQVPGQTFVSCLRVCGCVLKLQGGLESPGDFDKRQISRTYLQK